uniref:F-box domain-containing protein n=1 Tax=Percolomonas cosmopolitus TaxID=63605 RepID=A0A7S1KMH7_9EUKA|mmetsp:Transcript_1672/g.5855  ORF Transcript_1672/g.5855 Transcript_1672/m.5855 type:complete len:745 (+) Transcript_1672:196-2430(+)|eukprot:CAMPEP_0117439170 /NCGR_PEP_ID=MMETSP0759-20121206/2429_1 /TAXON_ID=63605 /ORGANISM="Percolomonas cosmopolitus, Strain WS" /LENGTH=744 /DNA_ID=CAMNT_0005230881 /DNA_START=121 /DNA_END=2355 /DNA_ORIENTATION=-
MNTSSPHWVISSADQGSMSQQQHAPLQSTTHSAVAASSHPSHPSTSSLHREILLLERLLKSSKSQNKQLTNQNVSLKQAISHQQQFYEDKLKNFERRLTGAKIKLQKHTSSAEYKKFILKEVEFEKLLGREKVLRGRIDDEKEELRVLLVEIEEKRLLLNAIREKVWSEENNMRDIEERKVLREVVFRNLDTGECERFDEVVNSGTGRDSGEVRNEHVMQQQGRPNHIWTNLQQNQQRLSGGGASGHISVNTSSSGISMVSPSSSMDSTSEWVNFLESGTSRDGPRRGWSVVEGGTQPAGSPDNALSDQQQWHLLTESMPHPTTTATQSTSTTIRPRSSPPLTTLPPTLLVEILSNLNERDLCCVNLCSRYLYELTSCDTLWSRIYLTHEYPSIDFSTTIRPIQYKLRYILATHGLLSCVAPIQFFELYSCVLGTMGKYRLKILSFIRKSQYLKREDTPKKIRLAGTSNVRRGMVCVAFFHLKHLSNPSLYAGTACSSQKLLPLKCAMLHHQISRSLLEVRSREAHVEDRFTHISEQVFNKNGSIASKILSVEEKVIEFVQQSFERTKTIVRIQRSGGFKEDNITEAYISEFDSNGKTLSEGIIKIEIRPHDLAILSFSIVGNIVDKLCVSSDSDSNLNLSTCQKQVEESLQMEIQYLPHRMDDIRTKVEHLHIKKKASGKSMPCIFLSHELNFFLVNADGEIGCRKHYEVMCTPEHHVIFHYRNAFKRRDYQNFCTLEPERES